MRQAMAWLREGVFRLLGMLSKVSLALRRIRVVVPLSWMVLFLLALGLISTTVRGLRVLQVYYAPVRSVQSMAEAPSSDGLYYRVAGLAYRDQGYQEYIDYTSSFGTTRQLTRSYYLLLDPATRWGILVAQDAPLQEESGQVAEPDQTFVAGRLLEIDTRLHGKLIEDGWGDPAGMHIALHWMLQETPLRFPWREIALLTLGVLVIGFLLLTRWFGYVLFWPQPLDKALPANPPVDPFGRLDMQVTASLPVLGTRRRVQLVEALAALQPAAEGWKVVTYDEGVHSPISIPLPAENVEEVVPGRVYFGRDPRWGLWVVYRDPQGTRRRLYLSFSDSRARHAVYDLLAARAAGAEQSPAAP